MMKQPKSATSHKLSSLCRWIILLGCIKVALLVGLVFVPDGDDFSAETQNVQQGMGLVAVAASPFATNPAPAPLPAGAGTQGTALPVPPVKPSTSPFAQPQPEYTRPDEAVPPVAPPPAVSPLIPKDSAQRKQDELNRREQELLALQQQMQSRLDELKKIEGNVQTMIKEADNSQDARLRHLIDVYSNMKARQAAQVLTTLDERIAVRILGGMRGRQAGEILTFMDAGKAAKLSEALTRTQMPQ